jgi:hypothetical protein
VSIIIIAKTELVLGSVYITLDAREELSDEDIFTALSRHKSGDWGEVSKADWVANHLAVKNGNRILSSYISVNADKFWVITEADRSYTTILFPNEY